MDRMRPWWLLCVLSLLLWLPQGAGAATPKPGKGNKKKKLRLPAAFSKIRLPSNKSMKLFRSETFNGLRVIKEPQKGRRRGRYRPPTRRIRAAGKQRLRAPRLQNEAGRVKRRNRGSLKRIKVDRGLPTKTRMVLYRRWLGRRGWVRRWIGHVTIQPRRRPVYLCPRPSYCKTLKGHMAEATRINRRKRSRPLTAWSYKRVLERTFGYEIELQQK